MNNLLEIRIRQVYPTGLLWAFDESQLGKDDQADRIKLVLEGAAKSAPLRMSLEPGDKLLYALAITHADDASGMAGDILFMRHHTHAHPLFVQFMQQIHDFHAGF